MADLSESLFDACQLIVDKTVEKLKFDKTVLATILENKNNGNGEYLVKSQNLTFKAYSTDYYEIGDNVQVKIPNNDINSQKTIIGKVLNDENYTFVSENVFKDFISMTDNLVMADEEYGLSINNFLNYETLIWSEDFLNSFLYYDQIAIEAKFKTFLSQYNISSGDYGLKLEIITKDNQHNQTLKFSNSAMIGDTYNFQTFQKQRIVFDIKDFEDITSLNLYFYQEPGTFLDNRNQLIEFDQKNFLNNIFVKDIQLFLGYNKNNLQAGTDFLKLYTEDPVTYDNSNTDKEIKLRWLHWIDNDKYYLMDKRVSDEVPFEIKWYQYMLSGDDEDTSPDKNWRLIEKEDGFNLIFKPSVIKQTEQFKVKIICEDQELETNILTFFNKENVSSENVLYLKVEETYPNSNGNYYIYDEENTILKPEYANEKKSVKIINESAFGTDLMQNPAADYEITWYIGDANVETDINNIQNSMLYDFEVSKDRIKLYYKIKNVYNNAYMNNTIKCEIIDNNTTKEESTKIVSKTLFFGNASFSSASNIAIISYTDDKYCISKNDDQISFKVQLFDEKNNEVNLDDYTINWYYSTSKPNKESNKVPGKKEKNKFTISGKTFDTIKTNPKPGILFAEIQLDSETTITAQKPIALNLYDKNIFYQGPTRISFSSLGIDPSGQSQELKLFDSENKEIDGITWEIPSSKNLSIAEGTNIIKVNNIYYQEEDSIVYINAKKDGNIIYQQSIIVEQTSSINSTIKNWDGKLDIGDKNDPKASIKAPTAIFGSKDGDLFSGTIIGKVNIGVDDKPLQGVYGFSNNNPMYGLREDGTLFLGNPNTGSLNFNGSKGIIQSSSYAKGEQGIVIDLTEGYQYLVRNGKGIYLDARENFTPLKIGNQSSPNFRVEWDGSMYSTSGEIGGWIIKKDHLSSSGGNLKFFPDEDGTIIDLSYNNYAKVKIGIESGYGQIETENIQLKNILDVSNSNSSITGLFKIIKKVQSYNPQKDTKFQENAKNGRYGRVNVVFDPLPGYYPVAIVGVTTGHSHIGKIAGFQIFPNDNDGCTAAIYITFNGYKYSTKVKSANMSVKVLFLRKSYDESLSSLSGGTLWDNDSGDGSEDNGYSEDINSAIAGVNTTIGGLQGQIDSIKSQNNKPSEGSGSSGDKGGKK